MTKCNHPDCGKQAYYNIYGEKPKYCGKHKREGMVDVKHKRCLEGGCEKIPLYNFRGETKGIFCRISPARNPVFCEGKKPKEHKREGMIDVLHKRCQFEGGCEKIPAYNARGETKGILCKEHKREGMIDVLHKRCQFEGGCEKIPAYNARGETKGILCKEHKREGMIDVVSKRCLEGGCDKQPAYNSRGETKGILCKEHKREGMIDVLHKRCQFEGGCEKIPAYNARGETKGILCKEHKREGMIDVLHKRCQFEGGCEKIPLFNSRGETKGILCKEHKREGMVDVKNKKCQFEGGCEKQPAYNSRGETKGILCKEHKREGMINVVSKRCQFEGGCEKQPAYNSRGETKGILCKEHKREGMINVVSKRCQFEKCKIRASYGLIGNGSFHCARHADRHREIFHPNRRCLKCRELATHGDRYPVRCEEHSLPDDNSFLESKCCKCHLVAIVDRQGVCYCCDEERFQRARLFKQNEVVASLEADDFPIESVDTIIDTDCEKYRPDIVIPASSGLFMMIVEVDEHQHKSYQELCTCVRMKNISEIYGIPCLFIRYNPDEYKTPEPNEVPTRKRLERLKDVIREYDSMEKLPYAIGVIQMYYDGWLENERTSVTVIQELEGDNESEGDDDSSDEETEE
jgi:EsV-1-7 cysteine-rich motif